MHRQTPDVPPARPKGHSLVKETMNSVVRASPAWSRTSAVVAVHGPWFIVENAAMEMSFLILIKIKVFWSSRGQVVAFNDQRQGKNDDLTRQQGQSDNQSPHPQVSVADAKRPQCV